MGVRTPESHVPAVMYQVYEPPLAVAVLLGIVLFCVLLGNGRPIGAGDTRPTERVAASLVQEGNFDLDEYPEVEEPFARSVGAHRVSIYPVLSAVLAAPVFAAARAVFALDETGSALAGKVAAALFSSVAAALLFLAIGRRHPVSDAFWAAAVFALGTSVWSTSQALWQHPAAVLFLCLAVWFMLRAEDDPRWAERVALPLSLAAAARHADGALVLVLALGVAARFPRRIPRMVPWGLPGVAFVLLYQWLTFGSPWRHGFSDGLNRFREPWGVGHLGLLVSPAKGLLLFTPVVLVAVLGLARALVRGDRERRWLPATLGAAALAHFLLIGRWSEWHGGESWGPRMMTDLLPLLFVFLPEGLDAWPRLGPALAAVSVGVQALGAFAYDYRWERLYQHPPNASHAELWRPADSPILFHLRERVLIGALPTVRDGKAQVRLHPVVMGGPRGSRIDARDDLRVAGSDPTFGDVHLQRGARVDSDLIRLRGRWDGVFLRVLGPARQRTLELRVRGRGRGTLYVGERTFWSETRWAAYPIAGEFRIRHPYHFPSSGGEDVLVTLGKSPGEADLALVALVPPGEPDEVIRLSP